jgi:hypothetical protein
VGVAVVLDEQDGQDEQEVHVDFAIEEELDPKQSLGAEERILDGNKRVFRTACAGEEGLGRWRPGGGREEWVARDMARTSWVHAVKGLRASMATENQSVVENEHMAMRPLAPG